MTEWAANHCSTTLTDGSVVITGGQRFSHPYGSAKVELYSFTTRQWRQLQNTRQRRAWQYGIAAHKSGWTLLLALQALLTMKIFLMA